MLSQISGVQDEPYVASGFGTTVYHNVTTLYPAGLVVLLVAGFFVLSLPRNREIIPLLAIQTLVPASQRIVILGLDFSFSRILICVGIARILSRGEHRWWRLSGLDRCFIAWCLASVVVYTLRRGDADALIYKLGRTIDTFGLYCLARIWIRQVGDVDRIAKAMIILAYFAAVFFVWERATHRNVYAFIGGANPFTSVREGALRCVGPFKHPILAGTFWVGVLPWIVGRWVIGRKERFATSLGIVAVVTIVMTTASSTPLLGLVAVAAGFGAYRMRAYMRSVRWGTVTLLVGLHVVMTKPVWHLISRVSITSGSTGYHRYRLIDAAVNHWKDWFLLGVTSTAGWGFFLFDVTNQFVKEAVDGGILGLGLFIGYIALAFACVGRLWRQDRVIRGGSLRIWGLGVALFTQCIMFLGISINHGPQNLFIWLLPIGACGGLSQAATSKRLAIYRDVRAAGKKG
jgi:hypothetical protein